MKILGRIAYQFNLIRPVIPTCLHLIASALLPIYAGAHASLSRPSSAAKPSKREKLEKDDSDNDESEESLHKMEGLSPGDAIMFPLLAGCTLTGLYFIIKWLQDPALLNKILNWYFSVFGVVSVARLATDAMGVLHSYVFPGKYTWDGRVWEVQPAVQKAESLPDRSAHMATPLPGLLSRLRLPAGLYQLLWTLRDLPFQKLDIRIYIHKQSSTRFCLGPQGALGFGIACIAVLYYNLVDKTWWLTNFLGFGFIYSVLQLMSPTTFWTGTLILSSLFFYDIYFVFFTPLMVTVATKLDIPAKLLFPRPSRPDDDPGEQPLSMLGLGDVVLPGIMIGLALRFDLYLFYLRKQKRKAVLENSNKTGELGKKNSTESDIIKAKWQPATGGWGERFWIGQPGNNTQTQPHGGSFAKTYFHASLAGYVIGMLCTLSVMHIYGHAQPALLYLVPGVLGSLWGTALIMGDLKTMWEFTEAEDEESTESKQERGKGIESFFSLSTWQKMPERLEDKVKEHTKGNEDTRAGKNITKKEEKPSKNSALHRNRTDEIFSISISLPRTSSDKERREQLEASLDQHTPALDPGKKDSSNSNSPSLEDELLQTSESTFGDHGEIISGGLRQRGVADEEPGMAEKRRKKG